MIPKQEKGARMDTGGKARFDTREEAVEFYDRVRQRLQDVEHWHEMTGAGSARFYLCDARGEEKAGTPAQGDHFRIGLPAPGSPAGEGYDWVRIETVEENADSERDCQRFALRVRPTDNPRNASDDVAHFFSDEATSTFMVERQGTTVTASIHGRNETPNTDQTDSLLDKARNALIALPATTGLAKVQWSRLVEGWMEP
jgi:hypothetical protein